MTTGSIASHFVGIPGGLIMSCIAFSIVFVIIVGLMFIMMAMEYVCGAIDNMGKAKKAAPAAKKAPAAAPAPAAPVKAAAPAPAAPVAAAAPAEDDGELLAVITAAIVAACGESARVVAFRPVVKVPVRTAWRNVSRIRNTEGL